MKIISEQQLGQALAIYDRIQAQGIGQKSEASKKMYQLLIDKRKSLLERVWGAIIFYSEPVRKNETLFRALTFVMELNFLEEFDFGEEFDRFYFKQFLNRVLLKYQKSLFNLQRFFESPESKARVHDIISFLNTENGTSKFQRLEYERIRLEIVRYIQQSIALYINAGKEKRLLNTVIGILYDLHLEIAFEKKLRTSFQSVSLMTQNQEYNEAISFFKKCFEHLPEDIVRLYAYASNKNIYATIRNYYFKDLQPLYFCVGSRIWNVGYVQHYVEEFLKNTILSLRSSEDGFSPRNFFQEPEIELMTYATSISESVPSSMIFQNHPPVSQIKTGAFFKPKPVGVLWGIFKQRLEEVFLKEIDFYKSQESFIKINFILKNLVSFHEPSIQEVIGSQSIFSVCYISGESTPLLKNSIKNLSVFIASAYEQEMIFLDEKILCALADYAAQLVLGVFSSRVIQKEDVLLALSRCSSIGEKIDLSPLFNFSAIDFFTRSEKFQAYAQAWGIVKKSHEVSALSNVPLSESGFRAQRRLISELALKLSLGCLSSSLESQLVQEMGTYYSYCQNHSECSTVEYRVAAAAIDRFVDQVGCSRKERNYGECVLS